MDVLSSFLLIAGAFAFLITVQQTNGAEDTNGWNNVTFAMHAFSRELYLKIIESKVGENVIFSPASIYFALAMLYPGAGGETKSQLVSALHLDKFQSDNGEFSENITLFLQRLSGSKYYTLKIANRLFGQKGLKFNDEYLRITDEYFRAKLKVLDFKKDPSTSRSKINRWVSEMTSKKIKGLFPPGSITSNTVLALANAVYFKSSWLYKFDESSTKSQTFYLSKSQEIEVPMMTLSSPERLGYYNSETFASQVLELPYAGRKASMLILLPNEVDGLALLTERLRRNTIAEVLPSMTMESVNLALPKFTCKQTLNLKKTLEKLGMKNLFGNADLSGIADSEALVLSEALHKTFIAVNETGTEAAGATGIVIMPVSFIIDKQRPISFIVDRPFLFIVLEKATGAILFAGHIKNPLKSN